MRYFLDAPVKWKLTLITMLTCVVALAISLAAIASFSLFSFRRAMIGELSAQADIIGANSVAAITFGDSKAADDILSSLRARKNITRAYIFNKNGEVFAKIIRNDIRNTPPPPFTSHEDEGGFSAGRLSLYRDIVLDGEMIGKVYIESDLKALYSQLEIYAKTVVAVMLASVLAALFMSLKLQKLISNPLAKLAETAKSVSKEKNYSIRAEKSAGAEIGVLIGAFNEMLEQIQQRDSKLAEHAGKLEEQVARRTEELSAANDLLALELEERRRVEDERQKQSEFLRNLLESLSYPFYVIDVNDYTVKMANSAAGFGDINESATCYSKLYGRWKPCEKCPVEQVRETGAAAVVDHVLAMENGSLQYIEMHGHPVSCRDGTVVQMIEYCFDITERRLAEENLKRAKEQAEDATRLKDRFVSLVSHDLRSPFSSMLGLLKMMRDDKKRHVAPEHKETLSRVLSSGENMINLIDRLLNIGRLKTGRIVPHQRFVDARRIISSAIDSMRQAAERKGVELINDVTPGEKIYADPDLFCVVAQNLVSNAIKFSFKGGKVTVFMPTGRNTTIAVRDEGVGVDEKVLPDIFKHEETTSVKGTAGEIGTGLGLPFSKDIMEAHGGSLEVETANGRGSVFYAEFPGVRPTVMVIGDNSAPDHAPIVESLRALGADVLEADGDEDALTLCERRGEPHLVIISAMNQAEDWASTLEKFRKETKNGAIPIIVTASDPKGTLQAKAIKVGADDFSSKPFVSDDFIPRVKRFIG